MMGTLRVGELVLAITGIRLVNETGQWPVRAGVEFTAKMDGPVEPGHGPVSVLTPDGVLLRAPIADPTDVWTPALGKGDDLTVTYVMWFEAAS